MLLMTAGKTCRLSFANSLRSHLRRLYIARSVVDVFAQIVGNE